MANGVLLNRVSQAPTGAAVTKSVTSLLAQTEVDTSLLRNTFTAPGSGIVQVRAGMTLEATSGAPTYPALFLGVNEGVSTPKLRMSPIGGNQVGTAHTGDLTGLEIFGYVVGLSAGSHNFDLAYGVDVVGANIQLEYGGPNDASGPDSAGEAWLEVWDPGSALLGVACYDPGTIASKSVTSLLAPTKLDAGSNLSITFTSPGTSSWFYWRIRVVYTGASSTVGSVLLGLLESGTLVPTSSGGTPAIQAPKRNLPAPMLASSRTVLDASGCVTGVSAGSHTWDACYAVQLASSASGALKWGGPDNTVSNDAAGAALFEVWQAA